jgi:hypothetical protein
MRLDCISPETAYRTSIQDNPQTQEQNKKQLQCQKVNLTASTPLSSPHSALKPKVSIVPTNGLKPRNREEETTPADLAEDCRLPKKPPKKQTVRTFVSAKAFPYFGREGKGREGKGKG